MAGRGARGEGVPAVLELLAGLLLAALAAWRLTSAEGVLAGMVSGSVVGTVAMLIVLLLGVALFYLGIERIRDGRREARGEDDDRV